MVLGFLCEILAPNVQLAEHLQALKGLAEARAMTDALTRWFIRVRPHFNARSGSVNPLMQV